MDIEQLQKAQNLMMSMTQGISEITQILEEMNKAILDWQRYLSQQITANRNGTRKSIPIKGD